MTRYTQRIAFLVSMEHVAACNRAANAMGRAGENFSVRLSPSGEEPATHVGGSTVETDLFLAAVAAAPSLPQGMSWPEELDPADWQAVADHLEVLSGEAQGTDPLVQFTALVSADSPEQARGGRGKLLRIPG